MNQSTEKLSDAASIRIIRSYARRMCEALEKHIGVVTQAAYPMSRTAYQTATLESYDPQEHRDWSARSSIGRQAEAIGPQKDRAHTIAPPLTEQKLLAEWREEEYRKPLLIVAPAGSGKSCLLESFALHMAKDLLDDNLYNPNDTWPIGVPLLISLRKMSERGTPLNEYLPKAEGDVTGLEPVLTASLLSALQNQRKLVLLVDGFDELQQSAQHELVWRLKTWKGGFALTSRPGHGERWVVPDPTRQRTLQEMKETHARAYVRAYFTERPCSATPTDRIVQIFDGTWGAHLGRLLRRPLYLKAWCDFVAAENGNRAPASLGDLARLMFHRTLEARQVFSVVPEADRHAAINSFIDWFGRLALHCDEGEFEADPEPLARHGFIGEDAQKLTRAGTSFSFEDIARKCGFLIYSGNYKYQIPTVPLVEYVVGKYLADDAFRHPHCPEILIKTFQRWTWRPDRHEILDYAFDALWNPLEGTGSPWANALLDWAKEVGKADATCVSEGGTDVHDDWTHFFAISILRWRLLHAAPRSQVIHADLMSVVRRISQLIRSRLSAATLINELDVHNSVIIPMIEELVREHCRAHGDYKVQWTWRKAIGALASRADEKAAAALAVRWVESDIGNRDNREAQHAWRSASMGAAARVPEEDAAELVVEWIVRLEHERVEEAQRAWRSIIQETALRVREKGAADLVKKLMGPLGKALGNQQARKSRIIAIGAALQWIPEDAAVDFANNLVAAGIQDEVREDSLWKYAISMAAERVSERSSAPFIEQCANEYAKASNDLHARRCWLHAIAGAAHRIPEEAAGELVTRWIEEHQYDWDEDTQDAWESAIAGAVDRISVANAAYLLACWIEEHGQARRDRKPRSAWRAAIAAAVRWVRGQEAVGLVKQLIEEHDAAAGNDVEQEFWQQIIFISALGIPSDTAEGLVFPWLEQHDAAAERKDSQRAWRKAILAAACKVPPECAADLVAKFVERESRASGDSAARREWRGAVVTAAGRICEESAAEFVTQWIDRYDRAHGDADAQWAWRAAYRTAACRIRKAAPTHNGQADLVRLCNSLLCREEPDLAFEVAANNPSIAIIRGEKEAQLLSLGSTIPGAIFQAVLRSKQVLDPNVLVAPPLVRAAFIEMDLSALENPDSDAGPGGSLSEAAEQTTAKLERLGSQIAALSEIAEFRERCRVFETRLAAIESRLKSRPASGHSAKVAVSKEPTPSPIQQASLGSKVREVERPHQAIIDYRGDPRALLVLQTFYEIGYELYPRQEKTLNQIGKRFKERRQRNSGLRPLPTHIQVACEAVDLRPFMTRSAEEARLLFGQHFGTIDELRSFVDTKGEAILFKKVNGIYRGFTDLGWQAWEICRDDLLLFHQLIKESDLPRDEQSR